MIYRCHRCRKKKDSSTTKYVLVELASNKPRVHVCVDCHTRDIKRAAKEASTDFLPGAKLGI